MGILILSDVPAGYGDFIDAGRPWHCSISDKQAMQTGMLMCNLNPQNQPSQLNSSLPSGASLKFSY